MTENALTKKEIFEDLPVPMALYKMAIPTIISQLINLVYSMVDTFFIGRTGNTAMMSAVTISFTLYMMTIAISNLFGIGGGSLVSRLIGADRHDEAKRVSAFSVFGAAVVSAGYSLLILIFLKPLLLLFGASADSLGFAKQYTLLVVVAGSIPIVLSMVLSHLLRSVGYSKQASVGLSLGGILNIALDPLFMFLLLPDGMEVFGAALATLIANIISCIYLLAVYCRVAKDSSVGIFPKVSIKLSKENRHDLFAVGLPSAALTGLFDVANIVLNRLMSGYGDPAVAAIGIVMKAERLPNAINIGICQGMLPIVAYNFSSGNKKRMNEVIKAAKRYGLTVSFICLIFFEIFAKPIIKLFMNTAAGNIEDAATTIAIATVFLMIRCLASPLQFLNYNTSYCMQAMGDGRDTLLHAVIREIVFYIPFMLILNSVFGKYGLSAALIAGEGCGAVTALILLNRWLKKTE